MNPTVFKFHFQYCKCFYEYHWYFSSRAILYERDYVFLHCLLYPGLMVFWYSKTPMVASTLKNCGKSWKYQEFFLTPEFTWKKNFFPCSSCPRSFCHFRWYLLFVYFFITDQINKYLQKLYLNVVHLFRIDVLLTFSLFEWDDIIADIINFSSDLFNCKQIIIKIWILSDMECPLNMIDLTGNILLI